jgi:hypothetical protein
MKQIPTTVLRMGFAALFFLIGVVAILFYPLPISDPDVSIEVLYVRYACGECYVQHRILKASKHGEVALTDRTGRNFDNENDSPIRFIGWDVLVFYKGDDEAISKHLDTHLNSDGACRAPTFRLRGQLKRKLIYALLYRGDKYDGTYFDANSGVAINTEPTCKSAPKEAALP